MLLLGKQRFSNVDIRIRVKGGGHVSQVYAIRQAIAKALVAFYQKCEPAPSSRPCCLASLCIHVREKSLPAAFSAPLLLLMVWNISPGRVSAAQPCS